MTIAPSTRSSTLSGTTAASQPERMTPTTLGPVNFSNLSFAGQDFSRNQGYFWLIWGVVAVVAILAKNLVRTRPGRALQAVADSQNEGDS